MIRNRGPNLSPGVELSHDRSGNSISPITPPLRHPFAVQCMGIEDGHAVFAIHEGCFFSGSGFTRELINLDTTTLTAVGVPSNPLKIDNGNYSTLYKFPLASFQKVLYVRVRRANPANNWEIHLVANDVVTAQAEVTANPPLMVATGEVSLGNASHGGFPLQLVASAGMCGMTFTTTLNQQGKKFRASSAWQGVFTYPVAIFTKIGDTCTVAQVLRSDIFFQYNRGISVEYIDTAAETLSMEASGTCPCGCGCGCGGCGGCCGGGGGGCGCVPPGCG
jgi:hypothetical protein